MKCEQHMQVNKKEKKRKRMKGQRRLGREDRRLNTIFFIDKINQSNILVTILNTH